MKFVIFTNCHSDYGKLPSSPQDLSEVITILYVRMGSLKIPTTRIS